MTAADLVLQSGTLPEWTAVAPALVLVLAALLVFVIDAIDPDWTNSELLAGVSGLGALVAFGIAGWYLLAGTGQEATGGAITLYAEALVVGAGDMGRIAAKTLADDAAHLTVANRTRERAVQLAETLDSETSVVGVDDIERATGRASVVVTATASTDYVLDATTLADAGETFVVDIAQPRDVSPSAADLSNVFVRDIDDLESVTDENRKQRAEAATVVEEMIDVEFERLLAQYKRKRADKVISAMYESAERVKASELDRALDEADFDDEQRAVVESMADAIVNQLLAAPTKSLRDAAEQDDWSTINTALQLFDPEFDADEESVPGAGMSVDPAEIPEGVREEMPSAVLDQLSDD